MPTYGYKLMSEEHGPHDLLRNAIRAEEVGFDFAAISDHFHPWTHAQGHAPFAWSVLGAIAARTERLRLATAVTCPTLRYHPAVVAQAAATIGVLSKGRFTLGLGAGENLNEHVVAKQLPGPSERQALLRDAVEIIQRLFTGDDVTYQGEQISVERAKLYDRPEKPVPLAIAAGGPKAAELAGEFGAGLFSTEPSEELIEAYQKGGGKGARYAEVPLCYAKTEKEAQRIAVERFAFSALGWKVNTELPTPASFEAATKYVRAEDLAENIAMGPDPERHVEAVKKYVKAGYDHIVLTGIGPDQAGFLGFFREELAPRLQKL